MVSFVQSLAEGDVPTFSPINSMSVEALVSETSLAVQRAFLQAHELVRWIGHKVAADEDDPAILDRIRFLNVHHTRAFELWMRVGDEFRVSSSDTCAHEDAIQFASRVVSEIMRVSLKLSLDHLTNLPIPNRETLISRLKVESARTLDRVRERLQATINPRDGWYDRPPPAGSAFAFGTISGCLTEIIKALKQGVGKTVRKRNGRGWYVMEVTDDEYEVWFSSQERFDAAVRVLMEIRKSPKRPQTAPNGTTPPKRRKPR